VPVGVLRLLKRLLAKFMRSEMILFAMCGGCGCVRMGCQIVQLR
jgi:hypothetical protein